MKKMLKSFADQMLSREQMKVVKGAGPMYCDCGGGNPTPNPDPANNDCMYVCSGASPYNTNYGMGGSLGSPGGLPTPYKPCSSTTTSYLNGNQIGSWSNPC